MRKAVMRLNPYLLVGVIMLDLIAITLGVVAIRAVAGDSHVAVCGMGTEDDYDLSMDREVVSGVLVVTCTAVDH